MRERPSGFSLFRDGGVHITVIWHRCGRRKAACNAIRETKSGTCSAASAYPFPPFPILASVEQCNNMVGLTFGLIGFIGVLGIGGATFQINRKKEQAEEANQAKKRFLVTHVP